MTTTDAEWTALTSRMTPEGRRRALVFWVLTVLISAIIGVVVAAIVALVVSSGAKTYRSTAVLTIDQPAALAAAPDAGELEKLAALRFKYAGLATTQLFAEQASVASGLPAGEIRGGVVTSVPPNSLLFVVGGQASNPSQATAVAQAVANGVVSYVASEQASSGIPKAQQLSVTVVTPASGAAKVAPTRNREVGAGALAGVIVFIIGLVVQTLRRRGI